MLFTSYKFILFLLILFILYYAIPSKHQWKLLLIFSYAFYLFAGPKYIIYILVSSVTIHITALLIQKIIDEQKEYLAANKETMTREDKKEYKLSCKSRQRKWLVLGLLINFGILFGVKYTGFFIKNANSFMSIFGKNDIFPSVNIVLPLGISFYTLQATGYLIDVYRNVVRAQTNIFRTSLFISFFPQLIQGPISRYGDLSKTLYEAHAFDSAEFFKGIQRIIWGFFKKMVIADCVATGVLTIVGDLSTYNGAYVLVVIFLYTLDLYADFTGGIDITIGIAQSLGIKVAENFEHPYFSKSLKEYWRRWHITMCEWFRIYVFYSISSGKTIKKVTKFTRNHFGEYIGKRLPVYATSFITWFATGIWHGASWNFILWGLLNWIILMVSEEFEPRYEKFHEKNGWSNTLAYRIFQMLRTFLLVSCLNLFDCYATVSETMRAFASIFTAGNWNILFNGTLLNIGLKQTDYLVLLIGTFVMLLVSVIQRKGSIRDRLNEKPYILRAFIWGILVICILVFGTYGIGYDSSQFIYNRF